MSSLAYTMWQNDRCKELDDIDSAHAAMIAAGASRRATQQVIQSYALLLSAQFQGFCRDLHTECVHRFVQSIPLTAIRNTVREDLIRFRLLDRGNPNPGNLGTDFNRLGLAFWTDVLAAGAQNARRRDLLEEMNTWRNAIAHHNFDPARLAGRTTLTLGKVRDWRSACQQLARTFDDVMKNHLQLVTGTVPW